MPKPLARARPPLTCGAVAQLVERMNGIHEVVGSTPIGSTTQSPRQPGAGFWRLGLQNSQEVCALIAHRAKGCALDEVDHRAHTARVGPLDRGARKASSEAFIIEISHLCEFGPNILRSR